MAQHYEFAVVGAGIEGSWTALQAVRHSKNVVLLDQFPLPHSRGSSHGQSRIIRHAYAERFHAELMPRAFAEWKQLERDTGRDLLVDTPLLCIADETGYTSLQSALNSLRHVLPNGEGTQYRQLNAEELSREFPQASFTNKHRGVLEKCAGILRADRCLEAVQSQFVSLGGTLKDSTAVTSLRKDGSRVRLELSGGAYITADKVAVCAGPWTAKLLDPLLPKKLPLTPLRVNVYYWRIKKNGPGAIKTSYIDLGDGHEFWGIPEFEYPGLVKYLHPTYLHSDPESRDLGRGKTCDAEQLELHEIKEHISKLFPGIDVTEPAIMETCMYTMTPDHTSIIDYLPNSKNIVFACGFSGVGFKKAPAVGELIVQMLNPPTQMDPNPFALSRFSSA